MGINGVTVGIFIDLYYYYTRVIKYKYEHHSHYSCLWGDKLEAQQRLVVFLLFPVVKDEPQPTRVSPNKSYRNRRVLCPIYGPDLIFSIVHFTLKGIRGLSQETLYKISNRKLYHYKERDVEIM